MLIGTTTYAIPGAVCVAGLYCLIPIGVFGVLAVMRPSERLLDGPAEFGLVAIRARYFRC